MKYLFKHLKPYTLVIIISLSLLFSQAICELYLPNLMSEIVNVGIQQSGVEEPAPKSISENGMKLMTLFLSEKDAASFKGAYTEADGVYTIKSEVSSDEGAFAAVGEKYALACSNFMNFLTANNSGLVGEAAEQQSGITAEQFDELYSMLPMLEQLPIDQRVAATSESGDVNASYIGSQMGAVMTKLFYDELGIDTAKIQRDYIFKIGLEMVGVAFITMAFSIGVSFFSSRVGSGVAMSMRKSVFSKVEGFTNCEFDKFSTASLITRTTNDVQQVQMLTTMGMRIMCFAPIMGIGGVVMALRKSTSLSWVIAVAVLVILGVILVLISIVLPKFNVLQKLIDKLNLVSRENLSGMMVIRAFGNEEYEEKRFDKANRDLTDTNRFVLRAMSLLMPVMMLVMNGLTVVIIWLGAKAIEASTLQIGDMLAFM
ncbi:MAG: ABC transporter ATP-binding protein, partial [Ruminococcaceae bacterium]|nr:ABC transporter ATP-binding protein [Oscillospiraceae bacterium]